MACFSSSFSPKLLFLGPFLLGLLLACGPDSSSQKSLVSQKLDSLKAEQREVKRARIDLILNRLYDKGLFNGNVYIEDQGKLLLEAHYGYADLRDSSLLDQESVFRIASISKSFTAMGILKLVKEKKLRLEDSLSKFYPNMPFPKVQIYHLLNHTSGIPDYISYFYTFSSEMMTYARNQDVISWLENDRPDLSFPSGMNWEYSNSNYVILAGVIEKVSKTNFQDFIQAQLLTPLKLENTYLPSYSDSEQIPEQVFGFQNNSSQLNDDNFLNKIYGDGGMYSSIEDLKKWKDLWLDSSFVSKKLIRRALSPATLFNGSKYPYGFAWHLKSEQYFHAGAWLGFKNYLAIYPNRRASLIILSNNSCPVFEELIDLIEKIILDQDYQRPTWLY